MPIKREFKWLYPVDWPQLSALVRFVRAEGRCQGCRRPHRADVKHLGDGRWWDEAANTWRNGRGHSIVLKAPALLEAEGVNLKCTRVYLATAHRDHDPTNNRKGNLRAFCQRCHLMHDRQEHQRRRRLTLFRRKALGDLFLGPYRAG